MSAQKTNEMRAAVYEKIGEAAAVLSVRSVKRPEVGVGQVRVRLAFSGINPTDVKIRSGRTPRQITGFQIPHMDGSGTIDAVGPGVDMTRIGQRVWVQLAAHESRWGTAAQWTVVNQDRAIALPDEVSFELGATLGVPAVTAANCVLGDGPIAGKDVLVAGGAGAVGRCAVQLAHWQGARVAASVSGEVKAEITRQAGADFVVNYREANAVEQLQAWSTKVAHIVEVDLGTNLDLDLAVAAPGTSIVTYAADHKDPVIPIRRLMTAGVSLRFMLLYTLPAPILAAAIEIVKSALAANALQLPPVQIFTLADIVSAHQVQETGPTGRVLVELP
ncbi:MAG: NADPH:quinone reductase [Actinomycetota bacterium]|nr:NADPH:quinone reductase [Actinomycetota bacterium]